MGFCNNFHKGAFFLLLSDVVLDRVQSAEECLLENLSKAMLFITFYKAQD